MTREPDEPHHGTEREGTRRPGQDALWKSVLGATGGSFGCERETFYRETVRDPQGWRLKIPATESILFGIVVDKALEWLTNDRWQHGPNDVSWVGVDVSEEGMGEPLTEEGIRALAGEATDAGWQKARGRGTAEPLTDDDWSLLRERGGLAVEKLLGLWPNRVKPRTVKGEVVEWLVEPEPEGTPDGPPLAWLDPDPGVTVEAQRKLHVPDVAGGRGMTCQPDFVYLRDGLIVGWVDVKALKRAGAFPAKWAQAEAVAYDLACTVANGGVPPDWHAYMEYRRLQKPFWAYIQEPVREGSIALARAYLARWGAALDANDPDSMSFNPKACAGCAFREPMPVLGFDGCPIGPAVVTILGEDDGTTDEQD